MFKNNNFYDLELILLSLLSQKDRECYEINELMNQKSPEYMNVKKGKVFTILYHFENSKLISSYEENNHLYYHLEKAGQIRLEMLEREYRQFISRIDNVLNKQGVHHE